MENYKAVRSGLDISRSVADYWEQGADRPSTSENRTKQIRAVNDILQGRSSHTLEFLFDCLGTDLQGDALRRDILDFLAQKELLDCPYSNQGCMEYARKYTDVGRERPLKIVNQALYDRAAKEGFPMDFFRESCFDHVTFYCFPERADCNFSYFSNCAFQVCRISGATFDGTNLDSAVMIRFVEQGTDGTLAFKSGGGITFQSDARSEYEEMKQKVYVPIY